MSEVCLDRYKNIFREGVFKINQIIKVVEFSPAGGKEYKDFKIIRIYEKGKYKMYLCENIITKCKTTITDMDYFCGNAYVVEV